MQRRSRELRTVFIRTTLAATMQAFVETSDQRPAFVLLLNGACVIATRSSAAPRRQASEILHRAACKGI